MGMRQRSILGRVRLLWDGRIPGFSVGGNWFARENFRYLFFLFLFHFLVFSLAFPFLDLPVADDANYFGYAKLFLHQGIGLNADWTPVLTYFGALIHALPILAWYEKFALYAFVCKGLLVGGIYAFLSRFTSDCRWSFLLTLLACVSFSYWFQLNGRTFANGIFLFMLAKWGPRREGNLFGGFAFIAASYLLRPEFILISAGFVLPSLIHRFRSDSWRGILRISPGTIRWMSGALILWAPIFWAGNSSTNRLSFAFAQSFTDYAEENGILQSAGLPWNAHWNQTIDVCFPEKMRDHDSFWAKWIPLYETVSANPGLFGRFLAHNLQPFVTLELLFSKSPLLSKGINFYIVAMFLAWLWILWKTPTGDRPNGFVWFSSVLILSALPCLLTRPSPDYIFVATVWFFTVIPYFVFRNLRFRDGGMIGCLLLAIVLQFPWWQEILRDNQRGWNWQRAQFLQQVSEKVDLHDAVIAEACPVFSTAFHDSIGRSVHFNLFWDETGILHSYSEKGPVVNYVLLEATPPRHLLNVLPQLHDWMETWGKQIAREGRFSFWQVQRKIVAPPNTIHVHSGVEEERIRPDDSKIDQSDSLVISWNFDGKIFEDDHIYVSVNEGKFVYLGRTGKGNATRFIWRKDQPLTDPNFRNGPVLGVQYRFQVYGMPPLDSPEKPVSLPPSEPVSFHP